MKMIILLVEHRDKLEETDTACMHEFYVWYRNMIGKNKIKEVFSKF